MLTGNKGEWSEIYTLFKTIADKELYRGDGDLKKLSNVVLPIIKILREESDETYEYNINQNIVIISNSKKQFKLSVGEFKTKASFLLEKIKSASTATFAIPEIEEFLNSFNCKSLKANSTSKSDIRIVIYDAKTGASPELGFSIKSQLGSPSTLLNAGKTTNFIFEIEGQKLDENLTGSINSINSRSKIKDRLSKLDELNKKLIFDKPENNIFANNMILIDSGLPKILAGIVYLFYTTEKSSLRELTKEISSQNPLSFDTSAEHPFYSYKIKRFLTDIALGMMPATVWTGQLDATGGYLIVKDDGEILSYHIYNRNEFEDYLINNTKLDTASSSRHNFGTIYEYNNKSYIKLNLQIRFAK